jgi:hypothetical protein
MSSQKDGKVARRLLDMHGAITLMARGSLQEIIRMLREHPHLREQIRELGQTLVRSDTLPDFNMVDRILQIEREIAREILEERARKKTQPPSEDEVKGTP